MRWEDFRTSTNVEDRRGTGGGIGIPMGRGGLGIGSIIILTLVGWALGIDPRVLIGGAEQMTGGGRSQIERPAPQGRTGEPGDQSGRFAAKILGGTEDVFRELLPAQTGKQYRDAKLVLFSRATRSGCGGAASAMGPFYCPRDRTVYIDLSFFEDMERKFGARGDAAHAYVIAHEVGHHVENVLGILDRVQQRQQEVGQADANRLSVRVELMADCLAGVWLHHADKQYRALEDGDLEEAMRAAQAIGDDRLQQQSEGYIVPESFTHGTSEQRMRWLRQGRNSGQVQSCDTFRTNRL